MDFGIRLFFNFLCTLSEEYNHNLLDACLFAGPQWHDRGLEVFARRQATRKYWRRRPCTYVEPLCLKQTKCGAANPPHQHAPTAKRPSQPVFGYRPGDHPESCSVFRCPRFLGFSYQNSSPQLSNKVNSGRGFFAWGMGYFVDHPRKSWPRF